MRPFSNMRALAIAALLTALGGCSEYFDRRDDVALTGGNAVATNKIVQMVDPWPQASANRDIVFDGNKMEAGYERYRTGKVIPPRGTGTAATYEQAPQQQNNTTPVGPTVTQPAAPVK